MGDRTTVYLTVMQCDKERVQQFFEFDPEHDDDNCDGNWYFKFSGVNWGILQFLYELEEAGIPYDSQWDSGGEYGSGMTVCRFTSDGERTVKEWEDKELGISTHTLLPLLNDLPKLRTLILEHHAGVTALPWENQEQYAKLFRARRLVGA